MTRRMGVEQPDGSVLHTASAIKYALTKAIALAGDTSDAGQILKDIADGRTDPIAVDAPKCDRCDNLMQRHWRFCPSCGLQTFKAAIAPPVT